MAFLLTAAILAVSNDGKGDESAETYHQCLTLARTKPEEGLDQAQRWEGLAGGEAARHCTAVALIGLRQYRKAAERLESLAQTSRRENALRAGLLAQAGQAWLLAGELERAFATQTTALALTPADPELYVDRAQILAEARNYWEAINDLNTALELVPQLINAIIFRAAAYRFVGAFDLAWQDVKEALERAPNSQEALLERGILARLANRPAEARRDWLRLLILDPTTATADAARRNLELLDVQGGK